MFHLFSAAPGTKTDVQKPHDIIKALTKLIIITTILLARMQ